MIRQVELYEKIAADYDRMALAVSDQALQVMYTEFAQQWRDAAANRVQSVPTAPADEEDRVAEESSM